jgi:hypothetical protein
LGYSQISPVSGPYFSSPEHFTGEKTLPGAEMQVVTLKPSRTVQHGRVLPVKDKFKLSVFSGRMRQYLQRHPTEVSFAATCYSLKVLYTVIITADNENMIRLVFERRKL